MKIFPFEDNTPMSGYVKDGYLFFATFIPYMSIHLTVGLKTERTQYSIFKQNKKWQTNDQ